MGQKSGSSNGILLTCFILLLQCPLAILHQDDCLTQNEPGEHFLSGCSTAIKNKTLNVECYCLSKFEKADLNNQFGTVRFSMQSTGLVHDIINRPKNATCLKFHVVKVRIQTTKSLQTSTGGDQCPFGFLNYSSSRSIGELDLTIQLNDSYPVAFMNFNLTCLELSDLFRKNTNSLEIDVTSCKLNDAYLKKEMEFRSHGSEIDLKQKSNSKRDLNFMPKSMPGSSGPQDSNPPPNSNSMQDSTSRQKSTSPQNTYSNSMQYPNSPQYLNPPPNSNLMQYPNSPQYSNPLPNSNSMQDSTSRQKSTSPQNTYSNSMQYPNSPQHSNPPKDSNSPQSSNSPQDSSSLQDSNPPQDSSFLQDSNPPQYSNSSQHSSSSQYSNSPQSSNLMQNSNWNQNEAESILDFLTYLETKVLSGCNFTFSEFTLNSDRLKEIPTNLLKKLSEKQVLSLGIHSKTIKNIHKNTFPQMDSLEKLDLSDCGILHVDKQAFEHLTNLKVLILRNNGQSDFDSPNSNPNLVSLDLSNMALTQFCGTSDWLLTMSCRFPNLRNLDLSRNKLDTINIQFSANMTQLESLDLSFNKLFDIPYNSIIVNLPNLKNFRLSNNKIGSFLPLTSPNAKALELLDLSLNYIVSWDESLVESVALTKLTLNLSGNKITKVTWWMIQDFNRFKKVHLSDNQFDCNSCTLGHFLDWLEKSNYTTTATRMKGDEDVEDVTFDYVMKASLPCAVILGVLTALGVTFYICRYKIDYCLYITGRKLSKSESPDVEDGTIFKQDAFVVHCGDDADWVNNHLLPVCGSDDSTLHLSLYDLDSEPRDADIQKRIEECRRSVMVISPKLIESRWDQWERQMATYRLFDNNRDKILLIILGKIKAEKTPQLLRIMMYTEMCLQWPENEKGRKLFWRKLKDALGKCHCVRGADDNETRV